ncbi:hypothetical protein ACFY7Y_40660 [Streptomyces virginiae]|uniref:hypothetical protein n=1 Tax=Streptomyces virginiae TaxID=1961 RepID=UPI003679D2E4
MDFAFVCGHCGSEVTVWGKPKGFWTELYEVPDEWNCYYCDGLNYTPPPPWEPA